MSHLKEYLKYYKGCESPGYAVLITGEWGVGKTFQVKQVLEEGERYYVSLFGSQSADDIHSAVLAAMDPTLVKAKEVLDGLVDTSTVAGGMFAFAGLLPKAMNAILRHEVDIERTLVFDDLERCGLCLRDTLGIINMYVEHHGCRVVVIAHDEELANNFSKMKEKLFGQTIVIEPQTAYAFDDFQNELCTEDSNKFIREHRADIIAVFEASGVKSLRILKHVIEDLVRLHTALDDLHLRHAPAMSELVGLFSALNIEIRNGQLSKEDLKNRKGMRDAYEWKLCANPNEEVEKPRLIVADGKYTSIDLENKLLQEELIVQMLIEGRYDHEFIRASLNNNYYFLKPEESPPWKLVINFDELEDGVVEEATTRMQEQFDKREVTDSGEMLQIFSLRMMMGENDILQGDIETISADCKKYIDDLLDANRLPPRELDWQWTQSFERSHGGYSYWVKDAYEKYFKEVGDHLILARERALEKQFPEINKKLLSLIKTDGQAFMEQVSPTNNGENPYALFPVLSHIPAMTFVDTWLETPRDNWHWISWALKGRYEGRALLDKLQTEKIWVQDVIKLLDNKAGSAKGFKAMSIKRSIPNGLREIAEN